MLLSVFADIIESHEVGRYGGFRPNSFMDEAPEQWSEHEKLIFDMLSEVEDRIKVKIVEILEQ